MAASFVNQPTGALWGIASAQSGLLIESITETASNPKEFVRDNQGSPTGFAYDIDERRTIAISGELSGTIGTTGILGVSFGADASTAITLETSSYEGMTGKIYMESSTYTRNRSAWARVDYAYEMLPHIP